jgi:hypothetical protein
VPWAHSMAAYRMFNNELVTRPQMHAMVKLGCFASQRRRGSASRSLLRFDSREPHPRHDASRMQAARRYYRRVPRR